MEPKHQFMRGDGTRVEYIGMTTKPCASCNTDGTHEDRRYAVVMHLDNTTILECPNCGADAQMHKDEYEHIYKA